MTGSRALRALRALRRFWPLATAAVGLVLLLVAGQVDQPGDRGARTPTDDPVAAPGDVVARDAGAPGAVPAREQPRSRLTTDDTAAPGASVARVQVPSLGVDAPVIALGRNPDRSLEVPAKASEAGWWSGGAFPGEDGPAVIAGHLDSRAGPGVFFDLRQLDEGDEIRVVPRKGRSTRFVVVGLREAPKDAFPTAAVYGATPGPELRLITCAGTFDEQAGSYRSNLVVFARRAPADSRSSQERS